MCPSQIKRDLNENKNNYLSTVSNNMQNSR